MQTFQLTTEAIWYGEMSFSPDGRWLGLSGQPFVLLDTTGRDEPKQLPLGAFRRGFTFVRGGSALAYLANSQLLCEYELATRKKRQRKIEDGYAKGIAAGPGGETFYLSVSGPRYRGPTAIRVISASDLKVRAQFGAVSDDLEALGLSAD